MVLMFVLVFSMVLMCVLVFSMVLMCVLVFSMVLMCVLVFSFHIGTGVSSSGNGTSFEFMPPILLQGDLVIQIRTTHTLNVPPGTQGRGRGGGGVECGEGAGSLIASVAFHTAFNNGALTFTALDMDWNEEVASLLFASGRRPALVLGERKLATQ
jgi:hypothetical protein